MFDRSHDPSAARRPSRPSHRTRRPVAALWLRRAAVLLTVVFAIPQAQGQPTASGTADRGLAVPCSSGIPTWPADGARVGLKELDNRPLEWSSCGFGRFEVEVEEPDGTRRSTITSANTWNFKQAKLCEENPLTCLEATASGPAPDPTATIDLGTGASRSEESGWYTWRVRDCSGRCGPWREASFIGVSGSRVKAQGSQLMLGGVPYNFVGANLAKVMYLDNVHIQRQLRSARGMGATVVRVWLFRNDTTVEGAKAKLTDFLDQMSAISGSMRAIVSFVDLYATGHHLPADVDAYNTADGYLAHDWFVRGHPDQDYTDAFEGAVQSVVFDFAGDSRILAWALGNELRAGRIQEISEFSTSMGALIRANGSQLVTGGYKSTSHASSSLTHVPAGQLYGGGALDFMTVHGYDLSWRFPGAPYGNGDHSYQDLDYTWAMAHGLPFVLEEYGFTGALTKNAGCNEREPFPGGDWSGTWIPSAIGDRADAVTAGMDRFFDVLGAAGVMQWGLMDGPDDTNTGDRCAGLDRKFHTDFDSVYCAYQERGSSFGASCRPLRPNLLSPSPGQELPADTVTVDFEWRENGPPADGYRLEVSDVFPFPGSPLYTESGPIQQDGTGPRTLQVDVTGIFTCDQQYYWRVTHDNCCGTAPPSTSGTFRTAPCAPTGADLGVAVSVNDASPSVGGQVTYTIQVTNHGPEAANSVVVGSATASTPSGGLSYHSHTQTAGSYTNANGNWSLPSLEVGVTETLSLVVDVLQPAGTHVTTVSRDQSSPGDPIGANDSATVTVVSHSGPPPACDPPAGGQELMVNGFFDGGTGSWHLTFPSGSSSGVGTEGCCSSPPSGYPNAYGRANGNGGILGLWQDIPNARPGAYRLSARMKTENGASGGWIQADNGSPNQTYCQSQSATPSGWTEVECCFQLSSSEPLHVALNAANGANGSRVLWDDVSLVGPAPGLPRRQVEASGGGTFYLDGGGTALAWGHNYRGQFGNGNNNGSVVPVASGFANNRDLAAGNPFTCSARTSGHVWCSGDGATTPYRVHGFAADAVEVATDGGHHCARLTDGRVQCWGLNFAGQLGDGTTTSSTSPVTVSGLTDAVAISVGNWHSCAVRAGGGVVCWGDNASGQLGDGTTQQRTTPVTVQGLTAAVDLDTDDRHTCAAQANGQVLCWGRNASGQLGDGTVTQRTTAVAVSGIGDAVQVGVGNDHSCARLADGRVRCWGDNEDGQLGDGTTTSRTTPVLVEVLGGGVLRGAEDLSVGGIHACVVGSGGTLPGTVSCWGNNDVGQLGDGGVEASPYAVAVSGIP
ncbi:MAG: hypothetical protein AAGD06_00835 [Acidobacteriota bacterium]